MATYIELRSLFSNDELKNRVDIAVIIAANNLLSGTPTMEEQKFASAVFSNPRSAADKALMATLATNRSSTLAQITGASDAALQAAVDAVIPALIVAHTG